MNRDEKIDAIVEARIESIFSCDVQAWVENVIRYGAAYEGLETMTDDEVDGQYKEYCQEEEEESVPSRRCTECSKPMSEGFMVDNGYQYFCSEDCLTKHYTLEEWDAMYADGSTDSFWTEWED